MRLYIVKPMKNQQKGNIARQQEATKIWEPRRAEIWALYANGAKSQQEMADGYGVTLAGFQRALKRMGIPSKSRGRPGAANGRFKHGREVRIYRSMVEKDRCVRCDATENLCIHHKDEDHYNNTPGNLEVMCMSCHSSMHKKAWWNSRKDGPS